MLRLVAMVALGGAAGSVARYLLAGRIAAWTGMASFPWGTLAVNVIGCTVMGALVELSALVWSPSPEVRALLMVGVLGGFTTFSSFALDVGFLAGRGAYWAGIAYLAASVLLSLIGFFTALYVVRNLV
jgi:CrcB protein